LKHYIIVFESKESGQLIAAGTLLIEAKFIHAGANYGHIEDIVVDSTFRG
jgi:glucosamine-phosphate N-acetyltransferase